VVAQGELHNSAQRCSEHCLLELQGTCIDAVSGARRSYEAQALMPASGAGTELHMGVLVQPGVSGDATNIGRRCYKM
jgi:hypothetical protein